MSSSTMFAPPPRRVLQSPRTPPTSAAEFTTTSLPITPPPPPSHPSTSKPSVIINSNSTDPGTPSTWKSRWRARSADWGKKAFDTGIHISDAVGVRVNTFTEKRLGTETFWPVTDDFVVQMDKAARILRSFTVEGLVTYEKPKDDNFKVESITDETGEDSMNAEHYTDSKVDRPESLPAYAAESFPESTDQKSQTTSNKKNDKRKKEIQEKGKGKEKLKKNLNKVDKVVRKIPPKVIASAKGLAIFTSMRSGLAPFGGAGGSGIVVAKLPDGRWSPPASIMPGNLTAGFLIGVDIYDCVLVIRSQKALDSFATHKATLGAEIGVATGPFGTGAAVEVGIEAAPVFSYVRSRGLYAGVELVGQVFFERSDENAKMYHWPGVKAGDILAGKVKVPLEAANLYKALIDAETGRAQGEHLDTILQEGLQDLVLNEGETLRLPPTPDMTDGTEQSEDPETEKIHYPTRPGSFIDGVWPTYFFGGKAKNGPPTLPQRRSLPLEKMVGEAEKEEGENNEQLAARKKATKVMMHMEDEDVEVQGRDEDEGEVEWQGSEQKKVVLDQVSENKED